MRRPDILVLDHVLTTRDAAERLAIRARLRGLLPQATILHLEPVLEPREAFDVTFEIANGRLLDDDAAGEDDGEQSDMVRKVRALGQTSLFGGLSRAQLRVLAFASAWFEAPSGTYIFREGEEADAAYLVTEGVAELVWSDVEELEFEQRFVRPGRLIGDLSVIRSEKRHLDLIAREDVRGLRIGASELRDVIAHDPEIAVSLLETVSGYLLDTAGQLRAIVRDDNKDEPGRK